MKKKRDSVQDLDNILKSNSGSNKYIFYFNKTFFPQEVLDDFTSYGGIIDKVWNNKFNSVSGFSGRINNTDDLTSFIMNYPNLNIENDERIFTQMNYAGLQAGIFNKSWFQNGLKGVKNGSTAILDTGISDDNPYFPSGYSPNDFTGNIIAWNDYILGKSDPYDDNGHGTLISSIIGGTGSYTYNSSKPIKLNIYGNYSHSELFGNDYLITQNYTFKVSSFNISKANSILNINITWSLLSKGINKFGILLFKNNTLLSSNYSSTPDALITLKHNISSSGTGIYDIFIGYEHERLTNPIFNFTINLKFYPEFYIENYSYFTGVSNASKLVVYKVLNQSGIGYTSTLIEAFADIIENKLKYHILSVCLSLGSNGEKSEAVNKLIDEIIAEGIMVIIAAGNNGIKGSDPLNSLALNENAIVVGAINDKDQLTSYSSMGKELKNGIIKPDLVAPGGCSNPSHREIISADSKSNETITSYGTSISAAIVTGVYNLLVQSKWENWSNWMLQDTSKAVKMIKASLLMTASETNQNREDDYLTNTINEGLAKYSPSRSLLPLTNGLKDFHEGYGRINFQAAVDALNKQLFVNSTTQASLVSSLDNPLKNHVFARQINLTKNTQYRFNISYDENNANLEMFLFSQNYRTNGEPVLLQASRRITGNDNQFYFIPRKNETNCIIVIKAIDGETKFNLSINTVVNKFSPEMGIPEIRYANSQKNSTVISFREFDGQNPPENNTFDIYRFYIEYFDNDSSNIPPQEVYLSIIGKPRNYSMTQTNPIDRNFTDGVIFQSEYINLYKNQTYQYFFTGSDGDFIFTTNYFNLTVIYPSNERDFPYYHSFNDGLDNWTLTGTGWDILHQNNTYDNKSGVVGEVWDALYFGTYHNFPKNYTYQPIIYGEDPFPNGSLISPIFDLRKISNFTIPILEFGLRISVNSGDFVYFQVNPNGTGWITLKTYSNMEREWFLEKINLTDYKGNYVQFRFNTSLDENFDPINYKGILIDCFNLFNYSNNNKPLAIDYTDLNQSIFNLENFHFSVEYYDLDNNYPEYIFLEIGNHNYSMVNIKGDWNSNDGIEFVKTLVLNKLSNLSFRFYFSDGKYKNKTEIINEDNTLINFGNPIPLNFGLNKDGKIIGYTFSNITNNDYYIAGKPVPTESTPWLKAENTWHHVTKLGKDYLFGGRGLSFGSTTRGYQNDWNAQLITRPLYLGDEYNTYLIYDFDISLQNELNLTSDLDKCIVSLSKDYGESWIKLKQYLYNDDPLSGTAKIDISNYKSETIMIKFTMYSNNISIGVGYGWLLSNIYIGYDKSTDFISPNINIINPKNNQRVQSTIEISAYISDNQDLDLLRIMLYINNNLIGRNGYSFNSSTGMLSYSWDTSSSPDGTYEVKIIAYDTTGNRAENFIKVSVDNGLLNLFKWIPWLLLIIGSGGTITIIYLYIKKHGKFWARKLTEKNVEKKRIKDIDKIQSIKLIEELEENQDVYPLTLRCKYCDSWFSSKKFNIICPTCQHDQIYAAYNCVYCGNWSFKDEPGENYFCDKCGGDLKLIKRDEQEIRNILAKNKIFLKDFKKKGNKYSILD